MITTVTEAIGPAGACDRCIAIYWFGTAEKPKQFGVCFEGAVFNIARQSLAESMAIANDVLSRAVDDGEAGR